MGRDTDERFEHPARTWASASHRAFTLQATGVAMAHATYEYMRANATEEMATVQIRRDQLYG